MEFVLKHKIYFMLRVQNVKKNQNPHLRFGEI